MKQVFLLGAGGHSKQVIDTYIKKGIKIRYPAGILGFTNPSISK